MAERRGERLKLDETFLEISELVVHSSSRNTKTTMQTRYFPLIAACVLPFASVAVGQDKSVPDSFTKQEAAQYTAIQDSVVSIFASDKVAALKTPELRIKRTFDQAVKSYGVGMRLVIAKAMADVVPEEFHGYVAKRALSYSPLRAKELLASLSKNGANASVNSALGVLPTQSVHTAETAGAVGVNLASSGRVFELPQVDARRRVTSKDGSGKIIGANGNIDLGAGPVAVTAVLGGVQDNGFTLDGMGYQLYEETTGNLIGTYLAVQEDVLSGTLTFYFKNTNLGGMNGSGDEFSVVMTGVAP